MIYAKTPEEIEKHRKAFIRKWRLKHEAVANSLEEAGDRLFTSPPVVYWQPTSRNCGRKKSRKSPIRWDRVECVSRMQEAQQGPKEKNMKIASMLSVALLAGLSATSWASQASAESAQRDTASSKCISQAQRQFPRARQRMRSRTASYKACMTAAGFRP
jgi:hypothetical protein